MKRTQTRINISNGGVDCVQGDGRRVGFKCHKQTGTERGKRGKEGLLWSQDWRCKIDPWIWEVDEATAKALVDRRRAVLHLVWNSVAAATLLSEQLRSAAPPRPVWTSFYLLILNSKWRLEVL